MSIEDSPQNLEDIIDIASKAEYLSIKSNIGEIKLNSHNTVEIQPKNSIFGAKIKVEENGNITPSLTINIKNSKNIKKDINFEELINDAIENFNNDI